MAFSLCPPELELIMLRIEVYSMSHPGRLACSLREEGRAIQPKWHGGYLPFSRRNALGDRFGYQVAGNYDLAS